ncbi:ATP-binding protein [Cohnella yongneupensis]|uniref:histidine kinase n=1 Tax=Cohnella yongneupensis TaxID=425006 RepID=A0ABW0QSH2_9BACL
MIILYCGMFLSLWTIGTVMLVNNRRNAYTRWFGILLIIAGFASFSVVINMEVLPWMRESLQDSRIVEALRIFTIITWGTEYHLLPFLFLMCSLVFTRLYSRRSILLFSLLSVAPIAIYLITVPSMYPEARLGHPYFRILSGAYFLISLVIYWLRYVTEKNPDYKKNSFRTSVVVTLCICFLYTTDYYGIDYFLIGRGGLEIVSNDLWRFNFVLVILFVLLFVYYGMRYGFMGIKLKIEQQKIDYSMKNLTQGALILNHTLKNEVQKINYLSSRMKSAVANNNMDDTMRNLASLDQVAEHILEMMNRIKEKTDDIVLDEQEHRMEEVLAYCLDTLAPVLTLKNVAVECEFTADPLVLCDAAHVREVLNNLLKNAVDAVERGEGKLIISLTEAKRDIIIGVKDNGAGISAENAARIFDPFFTTKKGSNNYGLGLNYCFGVMLKHGGSIRLVETERGKGTWMEIRFPAKRVRFVDRSAAKRQAAFAIGRN